METNEFKLWAREKHGDQIRVNGDPYWTHTERVAEILSFDPILELAGLAHDLIEDTDVTYQELSDVIGCEVADLALAVTNTYTKEDYPDLNRAERKDLEAVKLSIIPHRAKLVKIADIIDNLSDIEENKPSMAKKYKKEKAHVLELMGSYSPHIREHPLYKKALTLV